MEMRDSDSNGLTTTFHNHHETSKVSIAGITEITINTSKISNTNKQVSCNPVIAEHFQKDDNSRSEFCFTFSHFFNKLIKHLRKQHLIPV